LRIFEEGINPRKSKILKLRKAVSKSRIVNNSRNVKA
jgi:hypothetical protein